MTLQLIAGAAPVPELGKMLGQTGVNLMEVKRRYDEMSAPQRGDVVPTVVTVFDDRSFTLQLNPADVVSHQARARPCRLRAPRTRRRRHADA